VICSYDVLKADLENFNSIPWCIIVMDEVHCLKNPKSLTTCAVQELNCKRKLGLTGTLMQNNELELHTILNTIVPGSVSLRYFN